MGTLDGTETFQAGDEYSPRTAPAVAGGRSESESLDLSDPASFSGGFPYRFFAALRQEPGIHWHPQRGGDGFWVVSRYSDLKQVCCDPGTFSSELAGVNVIDPAAADPAFTRSLMINMDPPQHAKYRAVVAGCFSRVNLARLEASIRRRASEIIRAAVARGGCEFVNDLAAELPMQVICELMGVPQQDRRYLYDLSNRLIGFDVGFTNSPGTSRGAAMEMHAYAQQMANERRRSPGEDLMSALLTGSVDGENLSDEQFNAFFLLLVIAGNETVRTAASNGMHLFLRHQDQYRKLVADPSLSGPAVEEILRYEPPVMQFGRAVTKDTELAGTHIREGDRLTVWYPSANRDAEFFVDADRFDIGRTDNHHLSFGVGEHVCLGSHLGRMELKIFFEELVAHAPVVELGGSPERASSTFINAIKQLPVRFF